MLPAWASSSALTPAVLGLATQRVVDVSTGGRLGFARISPSIDDPKQVCSTIWCCQDLPEGRRQGSGFGLKKKPFEPHRRTKCKPGGQCGTVMRKALPPQPLSLPVQKTRLQPLPPPSPGVASGPPAPPTSRPAQATPGQQSVAAPIAGQLAALARGTRGHLLFGEVKGSS